MQKSNQTNLLFVVLITSYNYTLLHYNFIKCSSPMELLFSDIHFGSDHGCLWLQIRPILITVKGSMFSISSIHCSICSPLCFQSLW